MKIYGCQFDIAWEDRPANYRKVSGMLDAAAIERGSLVFLPEMFPTGFSMNVQAVAEDPLNGPTVQFLTETASKLQIYLAGGFAAMGSDGKARNEMLVIGPEGNRVARYAKLFPFTVGREHEYYTAGDELCQFTWAGAVVAPFICFDLRFPEIFRQATRAGAQVIAVIASWPLPREEHWVTLLRARAIENQAYVIGVNRCGSDPKLVYPGRSMIVDPHGKVIVDAGTVEQVISAQVDLPNLRAYREQYPILDALRGEFLGIPREPSP